MITRLAVPLALLAAGLAWAQEAPPADRVPGVVMLNQLPGCYGSVRFDHRLHVGMSSMADNCRVCHHTNEPEEIQSCRTCHDPASSAIATEKLGLRGAYHRQCLGCHKDWAHENGCGFCHTPSSSLVRAEDLTRLAAGAHQARSAAQPTYVYLTSHEAMPVVTFHHADHTGAFGLRCADCHQGSSCGQCHGPGAARPVISRQQSCYRCHAETRCVTCHHLTERPRFDHAACANWRLRPGHTDLACAACHGPGMPTRPPSEACRSCHAEQLGGAFNHTRTGVMLHGDHAMFACLDCHAGGDDTQIARCTACHEGRPVVGWREVGRTAMPVLGARER